MALTRATRYILSDRVIGYERRDYEAIGAAFKINAVVAANKPELDPEWSVKALNDAKKESEKATSGGVKDDVPELRFAPTKKRGPGQALKLHVSARDMLESGDEPNFGWVDPPRPLPKAAQREAMQRAIDWKRRQPKIVVDEYDIDPRTGRRIESSRQGIEVKALGRSLGSLVPGGSLGRRAARSLNLIVDADGKFRCPPGTPAANQFTDEFGTNCFKPPASARRGLGRLRQWYDWHVRNGLVLQGFTEDSPEFAQNRRAMAEASQMRASDAVFEEQKRLTQEAIHSLMDMVGASQVTTDNEHLWDTLFRMKENGLWDLQFEGLFRDLYGGDVWDDTKSVQENLTALNQRLFDQYFDTMDPNLPLDERNALAKELVNRHHDVLGGYLDSLLREYYENPEVMKQLKSLKTEIPVGDNIEGFWEHEARMIPLAVGQDGFGLSMEINVVAQVLRPFIKDGDGRLFPNTLGDDGKIRIMRTDGTGTEAQQWAALQAAFRNEMDLERWREVYANDLTAARHQSLRAQAQHIGHHEIAHLMQYDAANKAIIQEWNQKGVVFIEQNGVPVAVTENPLDWDNETWGAAVETLMKRSLPDDYLPEGFPPVGIHAFEGSMLHILSGKYYQDMVQTYWGANGGTPLAYTEEGRIQLSIMLMEGMAELRALQKMGIVDSEVIDRHLEWLNDRTPPPQPPTSLVTPRWSPQDPDNQAVLPPTPRTPDPSAPPGGKPPSSTPLPEGPGGASMPTGPNGDWLQTDLDDWEWVPGFPVGYWMPKQPKGLRKPTEDSSPADVLNYEQLTGDISKGSKARRLFSKIFGFDDTALNKRKRQELDEQFETMRDRAEELIRLNNERKRTASRESELGLTPNEEAELYAAIVGMRLIAAENDRRRKLSVGQERARRRKGEEVMPGKYGDESFNRQYELLINNVDDEELGFRRRSGLGWRVIDGDALDRMTEPPDRARRDPNVIEVSDLPSVVPAPGRSDWSREPWSPRGEGDGRLMRGTLTGDRSMVSKGPETMATIREIDASTTKDDVYAIVDPDTTFTPDGFVAVKVPSDLDLAIAEGDTDQTIIFLPKGSHAVSTDREGPRRNLLLPPGDYETMNVDANNNRTLNVTGQDTSSSYAQRLRDALDAMPQPKTVKEHRERENLRRVLDAEIKPEARHSTSPFSSDNAVRTRMVHRRNHLDRSFRERRIEPFSLDSRSRNTERDVNAASELYEMTENFDSMFGGGISLADGTRIPLAPEVEEFVRGRDGSEIRRTLEQSTNSWHQGLDRRPRTRVTRDEILSLLSDGSIERPSSALSRELDADMGWPLDAPDRSRPFFGHLTHGVHEDIVNDAINALDRNGYPLRRRGEFFDHSGDSPHGSDLSIFGDIDLIMRPEVSMRTAYGVDDIRTAAPSPTLLNEPSSRVVAGHLSVSRRGRGESASQINNFLNAQLTGDFTGIQNRQDDVNWKIQAAIAGGFNLGDIERVDVPINTLDWRSARIDPRELDIVDQSSRTFQLLSRAGWQKDEIEFLRDSIAANRIVDLKSANLLRQHRTAAKNKRRFDQAGVSVRYTNPDSVDLFAKGDLSSQTASGTRIGRVRDVEDALRLQMIDEIGARQSTLRPIVQEGMRSTRGPLESSRQQFDGWGAPPAPRPAASSGMDSPGFRSERVSKMKQALSVFDVFSLPKADDGNPDYRGVASSTYAWTGAPDSLDQIPLQRIYDALGEDFMVDGRPLKDLMVETGYGTTQYFKLPRTSSSDIDSWFDDDVETDFDKLRATISDLPDEELRERLLDDLDTARTIADLSSDLKKALPEGKRGGPPPRNPSNAPAVAEVPPPEEVQAKIDQVLDGLPDGFAEKFARLQEQQLELKDAIRQRKEVQEQVVSDLQRLEQGVGSGLEDNRTANTPGAADKDKTAEVGNATRVKNPDIDVADHEPVEGENRGHAEIDKLAVQAHQIADSLVSPEHRDELADLLRNDPTMVTALQSLMKRRQDMMESFGATQLEYDQSDKTGSGYAGRELIEALIEVRGFDGKNLRVTEEELEQVIYVSGAVPLSRGGNPDMQRRHVENEDLPIGEGVDGAGLYFAVDPQGAPPQFQLENGHDAAGYAGENGGIIQGAISPSANMTTVNAMNNAVDNYRAEMDAPGSANDHPLVELRREWASNPETADLVESLDMMLGTTSSDNAGEYNNAVSAAALLLGYDGMNAYDGVGYDNRVVLLNRTAMIVSNKILSKDDFIAKRPWDKLTERAAAIAESLDVPIGLQGEERTQYILNETARRLEALNGA